MPYMLAPGARLLVGPGGRLEESLGEMRYETMAGSCCASCPTGLGATKAVASMAQNLATRQVATTAIIQGQPAAVAPSQMGRRLLIGGAVGLAALGVLYVIKRRKGRR